MNMPLDNIADPFSEAGVRARAREGLLAAPSDAIFDPRSGRALGPSDWDLNPEFWRDLAVMAPPRPAAVLVPIVLRETLTVLLTQRAHDMPSHPGQISFPGGKVEEVRRDARRLCVARGARGDRPRRRVRRAARLSRQLSHGHRLPDQSGRGPRAAGLQPVLDPREVVEVFEVPLAFLMDEANHQKASREWRGRERYFYAMPYEGRYIWGATAGMLKNMQQRLFQR